MTSHELVILGGARTPMAEYVGTPGFGKLARFSALDLGAKAAVAAMERSGVQPEQVDHTVFGNVLYTSADALYGARNIQLKAGIPIEKPALTVNRLCGSGIQSVISGCHLIMANEAKTVLAGGTESMSQSPHVLWNARAGYRLGMQWDCKINSWALCATPCAVCSWRRLRRARHSLRDLTRRAGRVCIAQPQAGRGSREERSFCRGNRACRDRQARQGCGCRRHR